MAKGRKDKGGRLALATGFVGAVGTWSALLSTWVSPATWAVPALAGLGFPLFGVMLMLGVLGALWFRRWKSSLVLLLTLSASWSLFQSTWGSMGWGMSMVEGESTELKCMTWNVRLFDHYGWLEGVKPQIMESIGSEKPDILCLQEYFKAADSKAFPVSQPLQASLASDGGREFDRHVVWAREKGGRKFGVATWSLYPIVGEFAIRFGTRSNNVCAVTDIERKGDTIRVFNAHFASLHFDSDDYEALEEGVPDAATRQKMWSRMKQAYQLRVSQVNAVLKAVEESPHPVVFCGDFNDIPVSWALQTMRSGLRDTHDIRGLRLDGTWQGAIPGVRIDHILVDPSWEVKSHATGGSGLSDHRYVSATLKVPSL